jgi:hypothetical protein
MPARDELVNSTNGNARQAEHEGAFQSESVGSVEHLQERMVSFLRTCDYMDTVNAQIHAEFGNLSFNLQDVRFLARTNKEVGNDLKEVISGRLLEETTISQKLGDLSYPSISKTQEDSSAVSVDFLRDDSSPKTNIFTRGYCCLTWTTCPSGDFGSRTYP